MIQNYITLFWNLISKIQSENFAKKLQNEQEAKLQLKFQ